MAFKMPNRPIRGLSKFIADLRGCSSREAEQQRVHKETAKIRERVATGKTLDGYERKKCVWKLVYISMLGYDVEFGQIEALNLIGSNKTSEKLAGYIATAVLLHDNREVLSLTTNLVKLDLRSQNEVGCGLALSFLANVGTPEMSHVLFEDVARIVASSSAPPHTRRKAYLALLRFVRHRPELLPSRTWAVKLSWLLSAERDAGCLISLCSLLLGALELHDAAAAGWASLIDPAAALLHGIVSKGALAHDTYNGVVAPWLQIRLLRVLQFFPAPTQRQQTMQRITEALQRIVGHVGSVQQVSQRGPRSRRAKAERDKRKRYNIELAVFFEGVNLVLAYDGALPVELKRAAANTIGTLSYVKDANVHYLRLESLARLAAGDDILAVLRQQLPSIVAQLWETDDMIRKQAINLLFVICNESNWETIVVKLLELLKEAPDATQEDIVLKTAVLVERFAKDVTWYLDTVFTMIESAARSVGPPVWQRAIQRLSGESVETKKYAARKAYDRLTDKHADETTVRLAAYLLGEFGHHIAKEAPIPRQLEALHAHYPRISLTTCGELLMSYAKLLAADSSVRQKVMKIFSAMSESVDVDVQQRAVELKALCQLDSTLVERVLAEMPPYPDASCLRAFSLTRTRAASACIAPAAEVSAGDEDGESGVVSSLSSREAALSSGDAKDESSAGEASSYDESPTSDNDSREERGPEPSTDPLTLFRRLCIAGEGILLAGPPLRVTCRHRYKPPFGRLAFSIVNATETPLEIHSIHVESGYEPLVVTVAVPLHPSLLERDEAARWGVEVKLRSSFLSPPKLRICVGPPGSSPYSIASSLPCIVTSFLAPNEISSKAFQELWGSLSEKNPTQKRELHVGVRTDSLRWHSSHKCAVHLHDIFNFHVQKIGSTLCCCARLKLSSTDDMIIVVCLLVVQFEKPSRSSEDSRPLLQLSVRSQDASLAKDVLQLVSSYIHV